MYKIPFSYYYSIICLEEGNTVAGDTVKQEEPKLLDMLNMIVSKVNID